MKRLAFWEKAKKISFSHVIKTYKSKLLCRINNQASYIFQNIVFDNLIASFITSVVACIIYCSNIIKTLSALQSALHASLSILTVLCVAFASLMLLMLWVLTSILSIWFERFFISLYFIFRFINFHYQFVKDFSLVYWRLSSQVISSSFWRQFLTRSLNLHNSSTTFYKSITSFARYLRILIDVSWKFWSSEASDFSELESAILLIHLNESTTLSRFKTSWISFVLILNAFAIRKFFKVFWLNFKL